MTSFDEDEHSGGEGYVAVKGRRKCACVHQRRIHVVVRNKNDTGYEPFGRVIKFGGKCLGGTHAGPMSCECMGYGE